MFTVEMESDCTVVTSMDESDGFEDVELTLCDDDTLFMRQWNEGTNTHEVLYMSYQQLQDIVAALDSPVGLYKITTVRT